MIVSIKNEREFCIWLAGFIDNRIEFGENDIKIISDYLMSVLELSYDDTRKEVKKLEKIVSETSILDDLINADPDNWIDEV